MFRIFLSQTPCVICRDFKSEFNTVRAFALISYSRLYTKRCSQITTFWELTPHLEGRTFQPRVLGLYDQPTHEEVCKLRSDATLTEECHFASELYPVRATSSASAGLGAVPTNTFAISQRSRGKYRELSTLRNARDQAAPRRREMTRTQNGPNPISEEEI